MAETTTSHSNRENEPEDICLSKETIILNGRNAYLYRLLDLEIEPPSNKVVNDILFFSKNIK